jgi:hypothetical protein
VLKFLQNTQRCSAVLMPLEIRPNFVASKLFTLPILDTLQKLNSLLVSRYSHQYQKTKGLKYPCKIDLVQKLLLLFNSWTLPIDATAPCTFSFCTFCASIVELSDRRQHLDLLKVNGELAQVGSGTVNR